MHRRSNPFSYYSLINHPIVALNKTAVSVDVQNIVRASGRGQVLHVSVVVVNTLWLFGDGKFCFLVMGTVVYTVLYY